MEQGQVLPHVWDGARDAALAPIRLAEARERASLKRVLSASYAFGGNNAVLILAAA
jgi:3-oxoacyl-[acyl-carrier-protein] synthase-1